jgi:hypothetical protein
MIDHAERVEAAEKSHKIETMEENYIIMKIIGPRINDCHRW